MATRPRQIGITGGIGAGKSLACLIFQRLGVPSYDADSRARWLMDNDEALKAEIQEKFGSKAYQENGTLNRDFVAKMVFGDTQKIEMLNDSVHPVVGQDYSRWVKDQQDHRYVLKEAALIFETGSDQHLDKVIAVFAPEDLRIQRVLARDPQRDKAQVENILTKQWPEELRQERADFILINDGTKLLLPQVLALHNKLMS